LAKRRRQNIYRQRILCREPLSAKYLPRVMARLSANPRSRQTRAPITAKRPLTVVSGTSLTLLTPSLPRATVGKALLCRERPSAKNC
jgi:hypothetical protein